MLRSVLSAYDALETLWESARMRRWIATLLTGTFLITLVAVEASLRGWLPQGLRVGGAHGHFYAVELGLYLLLLYEVVALVLGLAQSTANAAGKQFEIFSLLLVRHSFEEFGNLGGAAGWADAFGPALHTLSSGFAALAIYGLLGLYYGAQRHSPITEDAGELADFVAAKKLVALALLVIFVVLEVGALQGQPSGFFAPFYSTLVLADVLIVFLSLRYSAGYPVLFRNSGLALATVVLRLAVTAPAYLDGLLGVAAMALALGITLATRRFAPAFAQAQAHRPGRPPS